MLVNFIVTIRKIFFFFMLFMLLSITFVHAEPGRWEKDLSGPGWRLYLDHEAVWENDLLFLPPVDISALPVNPPSCGWKNLDTAFDREVSVPGTVEGYFWSVKDNSGEMMGNYLGVSWWSKKFTLEPSPKRKRITLAFESVNLRAEVFVNNQLVGYDLIGNTPFEVDITNAVTYGGENRLDVRITDPGGTFSWDDERALPWGKYFIPSIHGFGGISGKVILRATDDIHVDDIYVQNQPDPKRAKVFVTLGNTSGVQVDGKLKLIIHEWGNLNSIIWEKTDSVSVTADGKEFMFEVSATDAKLWRIKDPHLYVASATFTSNDGFIADSMDRRFGFRFFTVGEKDGDKRLYLNGERVYLIITMSRGFWPKFGMFPMPGMAERDMKMVINLGYNMMMFHRAIGQPPVFELADEKGILTYEEPGGYQCLPYPPDEFRQAWRKEKLLRMVIRDRSHPSLTNWNLDDWSYNEPNDWDRENITMVHKLDPSRIVTFNCISIPHAPNIVDDPFKLHMIPFDNTFYYKGWLDPYHFAPQAGYVDEYYNNPRYYLRYILDPDRNTMGDSIQVVPKDEIYFLGEEGAFGTVLNLEKIKSDLENLGADGWMDGEYLNWYNSYNRFLDESGMRSAFPTVENLTMAMGVNLHYFHSRIIENTRIMNTADGYVLNGWAGGNTNTDIVDTYRHPTADPSTLSYYNQPLYIAVKIRDKVLPAGATPVADIFIVNEKNLRGDHTLELAFEDPAGIVVFSKSYKTKIQGGEEFGQLLIEDIHLPEVVKSGYYVLRATLTDGKGNVRATGFDDIFTADYKTGPGIKGNVTLIDTSGGINSFLKAARGMTLPEFNPNTSRPHCIVLGAHDYDKINSQQILDMVNNGTTLIVLENARDWASALSLLIILENTPVRAFGRSQPDNGMVNWGNSGRQFVGDHSLLQGLPKSQAMNWEYQEFYRNGASGLRMSPVGIETIVGVGAMNTGDIAIALSRVPYGKGKILLSTLDILPQLTSEKPQSALAKKLFMNLLELSY